MGKEFSAKDLTSYDYYNSKLKKLSANEGFNRYFSKLEDGQIPYTMRSKAEALSFVRYITNLIMNNYPTIDDLPDPDRMDFRVQFRPMFTYRPKGYDLNYKAICDDYSKILEEMREKDLSSFASKDTSVSNPNIRSVLGQFVGYINDCLVLYLEEQHKSNGI